MSTNDDEGTRARRVSASEDRFQPRDVSFVSQTTGIWFADDITSDKDSVAFRVEAVSYYNSVVEIHRADRVTPGNFNFKISPRRDRKVKNRIRNPRIYRADRADADKSRILLRPRAYSISRTFIWKRVRARSRKATDLKTFSRLPSPRALPRTL